jgi:predicted flap endonuclease-1-like 5' DNA nuclease
MRSAHTALTRFSALTRESLETLREELAAEPPELRAAVRVAGIEPPEPVDGGGDRTPPTPRPPTTSTPLEDIRGVGPKRAEKLRAAGIPDLEAFLRTDSAKLVEIAGLDADVAKEDARKVIEERRAAAKEKGGA